MLRAAFNGLALTGPLSKACAVRRASNVQLGAVCTESI